MNALYDTIGQGYTHRRCPDPRIKQAVHEQLAEARNIVNIGAGAGAYEPEGLNVIALEPSMEMIAQRQPKAAPVVQGVAEALPFTDNAFDATMAILTVHHWSAPRIGLAEMRRVARDRVVILSFDPAGPYFWLKEYLPEIIDIDQLIMPPLSIFEELLGPVSIHTVQVPHDCVDGFLGAYWRRPEMYLDPSARAAISTFAKLGDISQQLKRLEADIASGAWMAKYGHLMGLECLDIGYRLIVAEYP